MLDVVVIGAGYTGLLVLHRLRALGFTVRAYDDAADLGGTWWWQGFPGAHPEVEGYVAQYLDQRALALDWGWSERFPAAYEFLRYLRFAADRLDLRRDLVLASRVTACEYDEARGCWHVTPADGGTVDARWVVCCAGAHGAPRVDAIPGRADFASFIAHTSRWPWSVQEYSPEVRGRRVGIVGTGVAGRQLAARISPATAHLTVVARTPRDTVPMVNPVYGWEERDAYRARFDELAATVPQTAGGLEPEPGHGRVAPDEAWGDGSLRWWLPWFADDEPGAAAEAARVIRRRMTDRLDPRLVATLVPSGDPRPPLLDLGFLDAVGREDVTVVDARTTPVTRIRAEGLELADGTVVALDTIALATGHEEVHPLAAVDVVGRDGRTLADAWCSGPRGTLGVAVPGFPNLLLTAGPGGPDPARCAMSTVLQQQAGWIARALADLRADGLTSIEASAVTRTVPGGAGGYRRANDAEAVGGYPRFTRRP